jgi:hypothetical protein
MTNGRSKTGLSATAQAVIKDMVDSELYNTRLFISNKYLSKGIECEDDSIELFNNVFFKSLVKNDKRLTNDYITGECDLLDGDTVIDIKTSWNLKTFAEQRRKSTCYEWQLRGYMWLYDKDKACTAHCLVDTPKDLCKYENDVHEFSHIAQPDRVIIGNVIERDQALEQQIIDKYELCLTYRNELIEQFKKNGRKLP